MIEMDHLTKRFGRHTAVDDIHYKLEEGRIYGFLGANGAGKTTTMNLITGYLEPTSGAVRVNGHDMAREPEAAKRCIGYLPEQPPVYPDMTVTEYIHFAAGLKGLPKGERNAQAGEAMQLTGTLPVRKRLIGSLSKGYRQRVGLAQALLGHPPVMILDEPASCLDPRQMIEMRHLIRSMAGSRTVLLSSHILTEVSAVCDYILILSGGRLTACDTPQGLADRLEGTADLELTVRGEEAELDAVLRGIPDIRRYTVEGVRGNSRAHIEAGRGHDIREALFYALAGAGLPILQLSLRQRTLEDIYLQLTGQAVEKDKDAKDKSKSRKEEI